MGEDFGRVRAPEDLHQLVLLLDVGPVHLAGQDIAGGTLFRQAAGHPEHAANFSVIEMGLPGLTAIIGGITDDEVAEFARGYARSGGSSGASCLYRSLLSEDAEIRRIAAERKIGCPIMAVGGFDGSFTATTLGQVAAGDVSSVLLDGVGHYVALEAPDSGAKPPSPEPSINNLAPMRHR